MEAIDQTTIHSLYLAARGVSSGLSNLASDRRAAQLDALRIALASALALEDQLEELDRDGAVPNGTATSIDSA